MPQTIPHELHNGVRAGTRETVRKLYEDHSQHIFRYLYYQTGDESLAEDLTSEVFIKMIHALPNYKQTSASFRAWLIQIARNLAIDNHRTLARRPTEAIEELEEFGVELADPRQSASIEDQVQLSFDHQQLAAALKQLSNEQRDVIILRFIEELSLNETAHVLHKSEDAIKGLQRRALIQLRTVLMGEPK